MKGRAEYEKQSEIVIVENKPRMVFNIRALTEEELYCINALYNSRTGLTNYDVFNSDPLHQLDVKDTIRSVSYTTIRRTLEDLVTMGWIGRRQIGTKTLYFLTLETAKEIKEQTSRKSRL